MTRSDFDLWTSAHYEELIAVARIRVDSVDDARDVVQQALARACRNERYLGLDVVALGASAPIWPWLVSAIRSAALTLRRSRQRQRELHERLATAGAIHSVKESAEVGKFIGPRTPFGEYLLGSIAAPCPRCGSLQTRRLEVGYDREDLLDRRVKHTFLVLGCLNGHRRYYAITGDIDECLRRGSDARGRTKCLRPIRRRAISAKPRRLAA